MGRFRWANGGEDWIKWLTPLPSVPAFAGGAVSADRVHPAQVAGRSIGDAEEVEQFLIDVLARAEGVGDLLAEEVAEFLTHP